MSSTVKTYPPCESCRRAMVGHLPVPAGMVRYGARGIDEDVSGVDETALAWLIHRACGYSGDCRPHPEDEVGAANILASDWLAEHDRAIAEQTKAAVEAVLREMPLEVSVDPLVRAVVANLRAVLIEAES